MTPVENKWANETQYKFIVFSSKEHKYNNFMLRKALEYLVPRKVQRNYVEWNIKLSCLKYSIWYTHSIDEYVYPFLCYYIIDNSF